MKNDCVLIYFCVQSDSVPERGVKVPNGLCDPR